MTSQTGSKTIAIPILANISRNKDNQTMKFVQLIQYNMRNIFLERSFSKCDGETIPMPISRKQILSKSQGQQMKKSLDEQSKVSYKRFLKNKKPSATGLPALFSA